MKENRQGFLKVNWPKAKRSRPGPFTCNQATFRSEARNGAQKNFVRSFASPLATIKSGRAAQVCCPCEIQGELLAFP